MDGFHCARDFCREGRIGGEAEEMRDSFARKGDGAHTITAKRLSGGCFRQETIGDGLARRADRGGISSLYGLCQLLEQRLDHL